MDFLEDIWTGITRNYKCCGKMSPSLVVTMRAANMLIFL